MNLLQIGLTAKQFEYPPGSLVIVDEPNLFTIRLHAPGEWIYRSYDKSAHVMGKCFVLSI
jgi:hypothetical protein